MFKEEYTANYNAEAEAMEMETDASLADSYIIECANRLVGAIKASGRTVMNPSIANGFGSLSVWIYNNSDLAVEFGKGHRVPGKLIV